MPGRHPTSTTYRMRNLTKSTARAAKIEKLRRERARNSLIEFASAVDVPGRPLSENPNEWLFHPIETSVAPHHALLLRTAERVLATRHGRAMILMPPGSAKSTYCSVVLPAYAMGRWPGYRVMVTSYGTELARKHGRRARQVVRSSGYRGIFNTGLSAESSAADEWALTNGSEYMAAGILSAITQATSDVWVEAFCDLVRHWKPGAGAEESGQIRAGVGPFLERRMRERAAYVKRRQFPARGDKTVRAQSIIGRMGLEGLYLPAAADWMPALRADAFSARP
jgi:hypothetical protein